MMIVASTLQDIALMTATGHPLCHPADLDGAFAIDQSPQPALASVAAIAALALGATHVDSAITVNLGQETMYAVAMAVGQVLEARSLNTVK